MLLFAFFVGFLATCALTITAGILAERLASKDSGKFEALGRPGYLYFLMSVWSIRPGYFIFLLSGEARHALGPESASLLMLTRTLIVICCLALFVIVTGGVTDLS